MDDDQIEQIFVGNCYPSSGSGPAPKATCVVFKPVGFACSVCGPKASCPNLREYNDR